MQSATTSIAPAIGIASSSSCHHAPVVAENSSAVATASVDFAERLANLQAQVSQLVDIIATTTARTPSLAKPVATTPTAAEPVATTRTAAEPVEFIGPNKASTRGIASTTKGSSTPAKRLHPLYDSDGFTLSDSEEEYELDGHIVTKPAVDEDMASSNSAVLSETPTAAEPVTTTPTAAERDATKPTAAKVTGQYKGDLDGNGKREGKGKMTYDSGDYYDGEFENDLRHGHGIYKWKNGNVYEGDWKDGNRHGIGITRLSDGGITYAMYKDGKFSGHVIQWNADGKTAEMFDGDDWMDITLDCAEEMALELFKLQAPFDFTPSSAPSEHSKTISKKDIDARLSTLISSKTRKSSYKTDAIFEELKEKHPSLVWNDAIRISIEAMVQGIVIVFVLHIQSQYILIIAYPSFLTDKRNANHDFIRQLVDFLFHERGGDIVKDDVIEIVKSMFDPKLTKEEKKVIKTRLKDLSVGEFTK